MPKNQEKKESTTLSNQLINPLSFDTDDIIFSNPQIKNIPNSKLTYQTIAINVKNSDGTIGSLLIPTNKVFSFGVSESKDPKDPEKITGYSFSLTLHGQEGPTPEEKKWIETFKKVVETCKQHILSVKDSIGQEELTEPELRKFNPLYYRKDKETKKVIPDSAPTIYPKLIVRKNKDGTFGAVQSLFSDFDGNPIDAMTLLGKRCKAEAVVKVESIFVGAKMSLQLKLYEANVEIIESAIKPLLRRPKVPSRLLESGGTSMNDVAPSSPHGSVHGSVHDADEAPKTPKAKKTDAKPKEEQVAEESVPVKKVIRKVKKVKAEVEE